MHDCSMSNMKRSECPSKCTAVDNALASRRCNPSSISVIDCGCSHVCDRVWRSRVFSPGTPASTHINDQPTRDIYISCELVINRCKINNIQSNAL